MAFKPMLIASSWILAIGSLLIATFTLLACLSALRSTKRLQTLLDGFRAQMDDDFETRLPQTRVQGQIEHLYRAFNAVAERLSNLKGRSDREIEALSNQNQQFQDQFHHHTSRSGFECLCNHTHDNAGVSMNDDGNYSFDAQSARWMRQALTLARRGMGGVEANPMVGPVLGDLRVPGLVVASKRDPLIPPEIVRPALARAAPLLTARLLDRGGHVGFPSEVSLGLGRSGDGDTPPGLEAQALAWLRAS